MGIPSFYRHLVKKNPTLIKEKGTGKTAVLALDLNCAIYHCLAKLQKKTPYTVGAHLQFEEALIKSVIVYIVKLRDHVQPTGVLYIAVDGVVPMAKIRQQRMRRFKSVWVGAEEAKIKGSTGVSWDRNAITPGTAFMDKLSRALRAWASGQKNTIVSDVYETGEGEQKIMAYLRGCGYEAGTEIVVYGLDADLIVLCLWHFEQFGWSFRLLREDVELKGGVKMNAFGEEQLLYFDIDQCGQIIKGKWNVSLRDYMGAMSFLGNDFVPHGLTLCIRDDGIDILMELLRDTPGLLVLEDGTGGYKYNAEKLGLVLKAISVAEESHIRHGLIKKLKMNGYVSREAVSDEEKALAIFNALPLTWKVERSMMTRSEEGWALKEDWSSAYYRDFMWSCAPLDAVKQWFTGIQWVLDYYTGTRTVDMYWYYPWYLPPLFSDIAKQQFVCTADTVTGLNAIAPLEQLIMVLPIESYRLLPRAARRLPFLRPEFYPTTWNFFSCGRRQLWECEPMIPMLPYEIVKKMTRQINPVLV